MSLGLEVAILPGIAIARRIDKDGDLKRHLLLMPALGLLVCLGISGACFLLGWGLSTLTSLLILTNIIAVIYQVFLSGKCHHTFAAGGSGCVFFY